MFLTKGWLGMNRLAFRRGPGPQRTRHRPARRLRLEPLEERYVPSAYSITDLGTLGGPTSVAFGLNNGGQVVGWADMKQYVSYKVQDGYHHHITVYDYTSHAFVWTPTTTNGTSGTMIDIDPNPLGTADSSATDINSSGQVSGSSADQAFIWQGGTSNLLAFNRAQGINNAGQVAGELNTDSGGIGIPHAVLYSSGTVQDLDSGNTFYYGSWGYGINEAGQVVGAKDRTAFLYSGSSFQDLGTFPGDTDSVAYAVNDATADHPVQVVGTSIQETGVTPTTNRPFVWDSTHGMQRLDSLSTAYGSYPKGINASSQIVGYSDSGAAILWEPNASSGGYVLTDLNSLLPAKSGWSLYQANAINDKGQIVGMGVFKNKNHAFLLTPTTPSALAQPSANALISATDASAGSTGTRGTAPLDLFFAGDFLATTKQAPLPFASSVKATEASAPILPAMPRGPTGGLGMASQSPSPRAMSSGSSPIDQVFAGFGDQFPDFLDIDLSMDR
jgi:probable HAF family extracellular repeat protein